MATDNVPSVVRTKVPGGEIFSVCVHPGDAPYVMQLKDGTNKVHRGAAGVLGRYGFAGDNNTIQYSAPDVWPEDDDEDDEYYFEVLVYNVESGLFEYHYMSTIPRKDGEPHVVAEPVSTLSKDVAEILERFKNGTDVRENDGFDLDDHRAKRIKRWSDSDSSVDSDPGWLDRPVPASILAFFGPMLAAAAVTTATTAPPQQVEKFPDIGEGPFRALDVLGYVLREAAHSNNVPELVEKYAVQIRALIEVWDKRIRAAIATLQPHVDLQARAVDDCLGGQYAQLVNRMYYLFAALETVQFKVHDPWARREHRKRPAMFRVVEKWSCWWSDAYQRFRRCENQLDVQQSFQEVFEESLKTQEPAEQSTDEEPDESLETHESSENRDA